MVAINTEIIVVGGRTAMARLIPVLAKKEVFGLGKCEDAWDRAFKMYGITKVLETDASTSFTQEEIQCLESNLLGEIQRPENLQAFKKAPGTAFPPFPGTGSPTEEGLGYEQCVNC